ncbi:MAG: Gfo/Idh/MocA family oxidoreductase [Candidatus Latescibacteria bacterium]|nr:Gfo/Idh/MocA family oxidoreductase [Candidatus Latescibacterota bacterium]
MSQPVRLAFVGCGHCLSISFGPVLPFVDGLEVVAAVDLDDRALARARDEYGIPNGYHTLKECLDTERVDATLIATPVYEHCALAVDCARRGVHVLLEKPMARTPAECDEIIAAHKNAETVLMVGFMKRFNRSMLKAAELLEQGAIGQMMGIRHNWDWGGNESARFGPHWRGKRQTWGGQWQDHGSHSVDLAHWWAGPIRSVIATFDITEPFHEVENEYNVICTHASGVRSVHQSTKFFHRENEEHYLIFGETGTIELRHASGVWQHTTPYELYLHRYGRVRENHRPPFSTNWLEEGKRFGQYKVELEHFVECVRTHAQPLASGESGRAVVEVLSAAYLSAQEKREVTLPLTETLDYEEFFRSIIPRVPPRYHG